MTIARVTCFGDDLKWTRENYCAFGDELRIQLPGEFDAGDVVVHYTTSGGDAATWLDEAQAGGKPFLWRGRVRTSRGDAAVWRRGVAATPRCGVASTPRCGVAATPRCGVAPTPRCGVAPKPRC